MLLLKKGGKGGKEMTTCSWKTERQQNAKKAFYQQRVKRGHIDICPLCPQSRHRVEIGYHTQEEKMKYNKIYEEQAGEWGYAVPAPTDSDAPYSAAEIETRFWDIITFYEER